MSERRFVFYEVGTIAPDSARGITESELKSRCETVTSILAGHSPGIRGWNEALGILLHGESPQDEVDRLSAELSRNHAKLHGDGENQHNLPGCEDEAGPNWKGGGKKVTVELRKEWLHGERKEVEQKGILVVGENNTMREVIKAVNRPSPAPTREEWEAWIQKMPIFIEDDWKSRDVWLKWFLSMPIVPKEKR